MNKQERLDILENGMTVGDLIYELERFDRHMLVINTRSNEYLPIAEVTETEIDYCYDEVIKKKAVSIW